MGIECLDEFFKFDVIQGLVGRLKRAFLVIVVVVVGVMEVKADAVRTGKPILNVP